MATSLFKTNKRNAYKGTVRKFIIGYHINVRLAK